MESKIPAFKAQSLSYCGTRIFANLAFENINETNVNWISDELGHLLKALLENSL